MEGQDIRQVVDPGLPNSAQNAPARQLGLVGVQAPRSGSASQVGQNERRMAEALGEIGRMGGRAIEGYQKKKKAEDTLLGEMKFVEGATEAELQEQGVSRSTLDGFRALKAKTNYNEYIAGKMSAMESDYSTMSSEDFRNMLHAESKEMLSTLSPDDDVSRELLVGAMSEGFSKLVQEHTRYNTAYTADEFEKSASNLLVSESKAGDPESLGVILGNWDTVTEGLSPEARVESLASGVRQTLTEGNMSVYEAAGGLDGLRQLGLDEKQLKSVGTALETARTMQETENFAVIENNTQNIMQGLKDGQSAEWALDKLDFMKKENLISDGYFRTHVREAIKLVNDTERENNEIATEFDPEFINDFSEAVQKIELVGLSDAQGINRVLHIADKYGVSRDKTKDLLKDARSAHTKFVNKQTRKIEAAAKEQEDKRNVEIKAANLVNGDFIDAGLASKEVQTTALRLKAQMIQRNVDTNPNIPDDAKTQEKINRHAEFLKGIPVKDTDLKNEFGVVGQSSPTRADGTVDERHTTMLQYFNSMRDLGMNETAIKEYAGDAYNYLSLASVMSDDTIDPQIALSSAWEALENPLEKKVSTKVLVDRWENGMKEEFFDDIEPSMLGAWFGGSDADTKFDEVLTGQVKEAMQNSDQLDRWVKTKFDAYAKMGLRESAITAMVKRDLSAWEYVMGNMVAPTRGGKNITELMGISDMDGRMKPNSAMISYMRDNAELLFPEGTVDRGWWGNFKKSVGDTVNNAIYKDSSLGDSRFIDPLEAFSAVQSTAMIFSEKEQRIQNDLKMIDITPTNSGVLLVQYYDNPEKEGAPVGVFSVPAKEVGEHYRSSQKQQLRNKL